MDNLGMQLPGLQCTIFIQSVQFADIRFSA